MSDLHRVRSAMKFSFKPKRGHNYHIVHETKTGLQRKSAWTLCDEFFGNGERGQHQPTCPTCVRLDNPLDWPDGMLPFFQTLVELGPWAEARRSSFFQQLLRRDYIDKDFAFTRRGQVLVMDWELAPVPMVETSGIVHARRPLMPSPLCDRSIKLSDAPYMTLSRYERLRKVEDQLVITCLACLGK